jgi:hypothetical protein
VPLADSQESNESIDIHVDDSNGKEVFRENDYFGPVAVQNFRSLVQMPIELFVSPKPWRNSMMETFPI